MIFLKPNIWSRYCTVLAFILMQQMKKMYYRVPEKMSKIQFFTLNTQLIPRFLFQNGHLGHMLHSIGLIMQKIKTSCINVSKKMSKNMVFDTYSPADPWIIFVETRHLGQMLHSVGLYHHAKN